MKVVRVALMAMVAAACNDPAIPDRAGVYAFADTSIIGVDTTIYLFHWPATRLPVRFWADTRGNMRDLVARGIGAWEEQFLYGEFRGALVSDSGTADVIVCWGDCEGGSADSIPPDVPPDPGPPINACRGVTTVSFDSALVGPVHVSLEVFGASGTAAQVQACMRRVAIHELGHSLGLGFPSGRHSAFDEDIMYSPPIVDYPSRFDRRSVEVLYHSQPTVQPPPP